MSQFDGASSDMDSPVSHNTRFTFGRGQPVPGYGRGRAAAPTFIVNQDDTVNQFVLDCHRGPAAVSTPVAHEVPRTPPHVVSTEVLSEVMANLAKQISENITASIHTIHQQSNSQAQCHSHQSQSVIDASKLNITVQSDIKPPPFFRGDGTDNITVHEWEDMMMSYLRRVNHEEDKMGSFIISRLTGKARDMVKVSLRSNSQLSSCSPTSVFDILKRHFSELTYSNMPMRDFYNTVPMAGEGVMDYWIRLNKAIDVADECLRRRGKSVEDPSAEVVMMFISHCPDPGLALSFSFKSAEKWTAAEVQEKLDAHQRDMRKGAVHAPQATVTTRRMGFAPITQAIIRQDDSHQSVQAPSHVQHSSASPIQLAPSSNPTAAEPSFKEVVSMLDKVLSLCTTSLSPCQEQHKQAYSSQGHTRQLCRVCGKREHSTYDHCKLHRLCRHCLKPGHFKSECPNTAEPQVSNVQTSSSPLN